MTRSVIDITNGPGKDDLLRAVAKRRRSPHDPLRSGSLEAQIVKTEERGMNGVDYLLTGQLAETSLEGAYFTAAYN